MLYPLAVTIETNRGRGEIRGIGPASVTFATGASFAPDDPVRFSLLLPDIDMRWGGEPLEVFCSGSVRAVSIDGALFVVEASIDQYDFRHTKSGPSTDAS